MRQVFKNWTVSARRSVVYKAIGVFKCRARMGILENRGEGV